MAGMVKFLLTLVLIALGGWIGLTLPDVDQRLDVLLHRSIITHGPLLPLVFFAPAVRSEFRAIRPFAMFACLGFAAHFAFDLFPRAWSGFALISLPGYGWTSPVFSFLWIGFSIVLCAFLAARLIKSFVHVLLFLFGALAVFALEAPGGPAFIGPLAAMLIAVSVGGAIAWLKAGELENSS